MRSLAQLKKELNDLGISTSTGGLKGDDRRRVLERRLVTAQIGRNISALHVESTSKTEIDDASNSVSALDSHESLQELQSLSLTALKQRLLALECSVETPDIKGEARRRCLLQRLLEATRNSYDTSSVDEKQTEREYLPPRRTSGVASKGKLPRDETFLFVPDQEPVEDVDITNRKASIPSKKKDEAVSRKDILCDLGLSNQNLVHPRPATALPTDARSTRMAELQAELHSLRSKLHNQTQERLQRAGITSNLRELSFNMEKLEIERRRIETGQGAPDDLVVSTVLSSSPTCPLELLRDDACRLIQAKQKILRHQVLRTKQAWDIVRSSDSDALQTSDDQISRDVLTKVKAIEAELTQLQSEYSSSVAGFIPHPLVSRRKAKSSSNLPCFVPV